MIQQAEEQTLGQQLPVWTTPLVSSYKVRLLLMQGAIDAANNLARKSLLGEFENVIFARIHIACNHPEKALDLLNQQIPLLESTGQIRMLVEARMLQAFAYFKQGHIALCLQTLQDVLLSTQEEGYIRLFVDEGKLMKQLLVRLVDSQRKGCNTLNSKLAREYSDAVKIAYPHPGIGPLSKREIEVMCYVSSGLSNDEIAQAMMVAKSTVQWHIKNIYGKLHIHNWAQIVVQAL